MATRTTQPICEETGKTYQAASSYFFEAVVLLLVSQKLLILGAWI